MYLVVKKFYTMSGVVVSPQITILKAFQYLKDAKEYVEIMAAKDFDRHCDREESNAGNIRYCLSYIPAGIKTEYEVRYMEIDPGTPEEL